MSTVATFSLFVSRRLLRLLGLDLKKTGGATLWLPERADIDPVTYSYFIDLRHVPTFPVDVRDVRLGVMGFAYDKAAANPFVLAFGKAAGDGAAAGVEAVLSSYYEAVRPASACEAMGLTERDAPGLARLPAHLCVAPWGTESIEQRDRRTRMWTAKDGLANRTMVTARDGLTAFGPVSPRKLDLEVKRTLKLAASMREKGYLDGGFDPPEVFGLRVDGDYRWIVIRGQHRFGACAAFGIDTVPARVTKIVRREDAAEWPHVVGGTYTIEGALKVFDRLFDARPPGCASAWPGLNAGFSPAGGVGAAGSERESAQQTL